MTNASSLSSSSSGAGGQAEILYALEFRVTNAGITGNNQQPDIAPASIGLAGNEGLCRSNGRFKHQVLVARSKKYLFDEMYLL